MRLPIGKVGFSDINRDVSAHELPPEMFSAAENVRYKDGALERFLGHRDITSPNDPPFWLLPVPHTSEYYWLYACEDTVYEWHASTHTELTPAGGLNTALYNYWTGGLLNGIPVINNTVDIPQMWTPVSPAQLLQDLTAWPSGWLCKSLRPFKAFLVAMNLTKSGVRFPHSLAWSHPADPGSIPASWDQSDATLDAGENTLSETGGEIVDGRQLRDQFMVYKSDAVYAGFAVGGSKVLDFRRIGKEGSALTRNCIAPFTFKGDKHAVFGINDCYIVDGVNVTPLLSGRVRDWLYKNIDADNLLNSFAATNPARGEVWFCFPETGETVPSKALVWNWTENKFGVRDLPAASHAAPGTITPPNVADTWDGDDDAWDGDETAWGEQSYNPAQEKLMIATPGIGGEGGGGAPSLFEADVLSTYDGNEYTATIERTGLTVVSKDYKGQLISDINARKQVNEVWPSFEGEAGTVVQVQIGAQEERNDPIMWTAPMTFTIGVDKKVNPLVSGRIISIRFSSAGTRFWKLLGYELEIKRLGMY